MSTLRDSLAAVAVFVSLCAAPSSAQTAAAQKPAAEPATWSMNATIIEACSCPMFCQCYFNPKPAGHPGCCPPGSDAAKTPVYCRFNNAFQVNKGSYGDVKLDGARFWLAGDLGGDFSKGEMMWCDLRFDPSVKPEQRKGITAILGHLYPVKWDAFKVEKDLPMEWTAGKDRSVARLDGGKGGEVVLVKNQGMTDDPIVIRNLRYWGAPRNDGFVLMANEIEAYRATDKPFEFKGSNGFMITVDIDAKDVALAASGKKY